MKSFWNSLFEATKEPLRLVVLSAIPVFLTWLSGSDWKYAGLIILLLRWLDKFIYEWQKDTADKTNSELPVYKGLTGF